MITINATATATATTTTTTTTTILIMIILLITLLLRTTVISACLVPSERAGHGLLEIVGRARGGDVVENLPGLEPVLKRYIIIV